VDFTIPNGDLFDESSMIFRLSSEAIVGHFNENVRNNARILHFKQTVNKPGKHTLKIHIVDPTVVVMKIVFHDKPLPASYFGPPEFYDAIYHSL
jgi:hypothetical protein